MMTTEASKISHQERVLSSISELGITIGNLETMADQLVSGTPKEGSALGPVPQKPTLEEVLNGIPSTMVAYQSRLEVVMKRLQSGLL